MAGHPSASLWNILRDRKSEEHGSSFLFVSTPAPSPTKCAPRGPGGRTHPCKRGEQGWGKAQGPFLPPPPRGCHRPQAGHQAPHTYTPWYAYAAMLGSSNSNVFTQIIHFDTPQLRQGNIWPPSLKPKASHEVAPPAVGPPYGSQDRIWRPCPPESCSMAPPQSAGATELLCYTHLCLRHSLSLWAMFCHRSKPSQPSQSFTHTQDYPAKPSGTPTVTRAPCEYPLGRPETLASQSKL